VSKQATPVAAAKKAPTPAGKKPVSAKKPATPAKVPVQAPVAPVEEVHFEPVPEAVAPVEEEDDITAEVVVEEIEIVEVHFDEVVAPADVIEGIAAPEEPEAAEEMVNYVPAPVEPEAPIKEEEEVAAEDDMDVVPIKEEAAAEA